MWVCLLEKKTVEDIIYIFFFGGGGDCQKSQLFYNNPRFVFKCKKSFYDLEGFYICFSILGSVSLVCLLHCYTFPSFMIFFKMSCLVVHFVSSMHHRFLNCTASFSSSSSTTNLLSCTFFSFVGNLKNCLARMFTSFFYIYN